MKADDFNAVLRSHTTVLGFLAHVDSGKTTLSEAVLYTAGAIRKLGRVDHGSAFLDNNAVEQERGITVFSKEARFAWRDRSYVLLDTPGHVDFSTEAERTLAVLDYALLIVSGADGVQSHTVTLWKLLAAYEIPTFIFVNKMDQPGTDRKRLLAELAARLGESGFVEFSDAAPVSAEEAAACDEDLLEAYLAGEELTDEMLARAVAGRRLFPVCFGSALKLTGITELLDTLSRYTTARQYADDFGARVYKISHDKQGVRQTHMKITGGCLTARKMLDTGGAGSAAGAASGSATGSATGSACAEKVDRIHLYSGSTFEQVQQAQAGQICAVTGLARTYAGQRLGYEYGAPELAARLAPSLTYRVILPPEADPPAVLQKLRRLEEEEPSLAIVWKEAVQEIHVKVMGRLELEILQRIVKERFDLEIGFDGGSIIYKETIAAPVEGVGHFEPLRHYAEVRLLLEPLPRGAGLVFDTALSEDRLDRNWQRLILTHLQEREHPGVLAGSPITDMRITLVDGRAHLKHTEGGDFRQATYRAVRQALRKAECLLLEPMYSFYAELPSENVGRLLTDIQRLGGECDPLKMMDEQTAVVTGRGAVASLRDYAQEVASYSRGRGSFSVSPAGYGLCHNAEEVVLQSGYRAESDLDNPTGSVFCAGGSAVYVSWDEVDERAHTASYLAARQSAAPDEAGAGTGAGSGCSGDVSARNAAGRPDGRNAEATQKELDDIFLRTYGKSKRDEDLRRRQTAAGTRRLERPARPQSMSGSFPQLKKDGRGAAAPYFIVDGYNVIFAWEELAALAAVNIDSAREALIEVLENYSAYKKVGMAVVFDGYRVSGSPGATQSYGRLKVIYTKEAQTADRFIEEAVYRMSREYSVTVVTSDRPVQMAALGDGAARLSARDFHAEVAGASEEIRGLLARQKKTVNRPLAGKLPGE